MLNPKDILDIAERIIAPSITRFDEKLSNIEKKVDKIEGDLDDFDKRLRDIEKLTSFIVGGITKENLKKEIIEEMKKTLPINLKEGE